MSHSNASDPNVRGQNLLSRIGRLLGIRPIPADVAEEMSTLRSEVHALRQSQGDAHEELLALHTTIEKLEKQIARAGKEQFKSNSLAEAQQQTVKSTLEQLREANTYRERELTQLRERSVNARSAGRMEIVKRLLPVLDGLDEALNAGQRLVESIERAQPDATHEPSLRKRVWSLLGGKRTSDPSSAPPHDETIAAWLEGLEFVRERLLDILSTEGVYPLDTDGEVFDPKLHVAVEATAATNGVQPGSIVQQVRRGYVSGDMVLRYAEVVVAR